jgi:hypothetical protein
MVDGRHGRPTLSVQPRVDRLSTPPPGSVIIRLHNMAADPVRGTTLTQNPVGISHSVQVNIDFIFILMCGFFFLFSKGIID